MRRRVRDVRWVRRAALVWALLCLPAGLASAQDGPDAPPAGDTTADTTANDSTASDSTASDSTASDSTASDSTANDTAANDTAASAPGQTAADSGASNTDAGPAATDAGAQTADGGAADAGVPDAVGAGQALDEDPDTLPAEHVPDVEVRVDADGVRTGDLVRVEIVTSMPEGDDVTLPEQELGELELHDRSFVDVTEGGRRTLTFQLDLLALSPGELELPALRLRVVTADGQVGEVETEPQTIEVGSHIGNEPDAQPRPPTQPVTVTQEDYTLAWVLGIFGALLLTALLAFLIGRWWRKRPKKVAPPPPPRPPWEVALERLAALERDKEGLLAEGRQMEFVDRVSDVVRDYLGHRYDFNGLESTSDEVIGRLRKIKLRRIALDDVRSLLADSDLVKFARAEPDEEQCDRMLAGAIAIVQGTAPRPGETVGPTPAATKTKPKKKRRKKTEGGIVVTKRGVTLPLSVRTIEEAQHEIGAIVGTATRDHASREDFGGTLLVVLGPELVPSADVDEALVRVHQQLTAELEKVPLAKGGTAALVIEHYHRRLADAAAAGESARVSVIDDTGLRHAQRRPAGSKKRAKQSAPAAPEAKAEATESAAPAADAPASATGVEAANLDATTLDTATFERRAPAAPTPEPVAAEPEDATVDPPLKTTAREPVAPAASLRGSDASSLEGAAPTAEQREAEPAVKSVPTAPASQTEAAGTEATGTEATETEAAETEAAGTEATGTEAAESAKTEASDAPQSAETEDQAIEAARRELRRRHEAKRASVAPPATAPSDAPAPRFRLIETAFPEAAERVRPVFAQKGTTEGEPLLRWVTGIEHAIGYQLDEGLLAPAALRGMKLSRSQVHARALENLRGVVPNGFAPGEHPAYLDGGGAALLLLPELVPSGESWLAYPTHEGTLLVMREAAGSTEGELERLHEERAPDDPLSQPVRVRRRGFEPVPWPSEERPTAPDAPRPLPSRGAKTVQGHDFARAVRDAKDPEGDA